MRMKYLLLRRYVSNLGSHIIKILLKNKELYRMIKNKSKNIIMASILCLTIIFGIPCITMAAADNDNISSCAIEQEILSYDLGVDKISASELEYLNNHPELLEQRIKKDLQYIEKESEKQFQQSMIEAFSTKSLYYEEVALGTNEYVSDCHYDDDDGSAWGVGQSNHEAYCVQNYADASSHSFGLGDAEAWAAVGPRIYITGSGSQEADIRYSFSYRGKIAATTSGNASVKIIAELWDDSGCVERDIVLKEGIALGSENFAESVNERFSNVDLDAGETYAIVIKVEADAVNYGGINANSDFWSDGSGSDGINFSNIYVDWD